MDPLFQILKRLSEHEVEYVLVGGMAAILQRSREVQLAGFRCRLLDLDALIDAKRAAGREKDIIGVRHLEVIKQHRDKNPGLFDDIR